MSNSVIAKIYITATIASCLRHMNDLILFAFALTRNPQNSSGYVQNSRNKVAKRLHSLE